MTAPKHPLRPDGSTGVSDDPVKDTPTSESGQGRNGKPLCGARKRDGSGDTCRRPAGHSTDHPGTGRCALHGGKTPSHRGAAQIAQAAEAVERYGAPRRIDPRDGLIEEFWRTAGAVAYCERRVHELQDKELVWGLVEETDGAGEGGTVTKHKATVNVWLGLYQAERDRFAKLGLDIVKLGLEERRDAAAERHSLQLAGIVRLFVAELGLTPEQQARVPSALRAAISAGLPAQVSR